MGLSIALQGAALFVPPLRTALGGAPLALADLAVALAGAALPSIAIELSRFLSHHEPLALPAPGETSPSVVSPGRSRDLAPADGVRLKPDDAPSASTAVSRQPSMARGGAQ